MTRPPELEISQADALPDGLDALVEESLAEGFGLVGRLRDDWRSGANRFAAPGEAFFVARRRGALAGVCGLNVDPFAADPAVGRVRRLYVAQALRRRGVARALVEAVVGAASPRFARLRVRTTTPEGDRFYRALGFAPVDSADATHERPRGDG